MCFPLNKNEVVPKKDTYYYNFTKLCKTMDRKEY